MFSLEYTHSQIAAVCFAYIRSLVTGLLLRRWREESDTCQLLTAVLRASSASNRDRLQDMVQYSGRGDGKVRVASAPVSLEAEPITTHPEWQHSLRRLETSKEMPSGASPS